LTSQTPSRAEPRVLICVPGVPHRTRGASTVLFFHYIDQLKRRGFHVLCLLLQESATAASERAVDEFRREIEAPGQCDVEVAPVDWLVRFRKLSGKIRPGRLGAEAAERARRFQPHLVLSFDIAALAVVEALGVEARRIVWLGDLSFQTIWLHAMYDVRERVGALLRLPKIWLLCQRWKSAYRKLLRAVDLVVVASAASEGVLKRLGVRARYLPYPWPIEKPFRTAARHRGAPGQPRFLFCGTLTGLGSRSALHYLLDALYPALVGRWGSGGFEILITGARSLPDWAVVSLQGKPELVFLGFVEDLYAMMDRCHAAIVPIDVPVGNRSRIVTALGYGLLVIAHPNTALGNPELVSGRTCFLADDPRAFVEHMARAHEDPDMAERIEVAARASYERNFEPRAAASLLVEQIDSLLGERGRSAPAALPVAS